jgi:hypothetical protein
MKRHILHELVTSALCLGCLLGAPLAAQAQQADSDDRWRFNLAVYLWGAGIDGTTRNGDKVGVGFDDIVENLDGAFMGAFEARKSKWSLAADLIYLNTSADKAGTIGSTSIPDNADVDLTGWVVSLQGARNLLDVERATVDLLFGARYLDVDSKLTLSLGLMGPTPSASAADSVLDGVIGVKGNINLGKKWYLPYYLDVGTGQSDVTWQSVGGFGYRFNWGNFVVAYRHIQWDFKSDSPFKDLSFSGPALGLVFKL